MTYTKFGALVASVGVMAFALASHEVSAGPVAASRGSAVTARPLSRPLAAHSFRRRHGSIFLPGIDGDFYGSDGYGSDGAAVSGLTPFASSNARYIYTYEAPWDWAHRNPPNVTPSDRAYAPSCTMEPVTVPGRDGGDQVVNVTRCY